MRSVELGKFARLQRTELTIATKFGIRPTVTARALAYAQRPFRRALQSRPGLRDQVRARSAAPSRLLYEKGDYGAAGARRSLHCSLRSLKTGYIDLLLWHDPFPGTVRSDEVSAFLEDARAEGLIRSWGITGAWRATAEIVQSYAGFRCARSPTTSSLQHAWASYPTVRLITFGAISGARNRIVQHLNAAELTRQKWGDAIGSDCGDPEIASSFLLRAAHQANSTGLVLFGSTQIRHIGTAAEAFEQSLSAPADLDVFISLVRTELCAPAAPEGK